MNRTPSAILVAALATVGAVLLPVSLFLNWLEVTGDEDERIAATGWNALEFTDAALVIVAAVVIWAVVGRLRDRLSVFALLAIGAALGVVALDALITTTPLFELGSSSGDVNVSREIGAVLATIGAGLVFTAGLLDAAVSYGAAHAPGPAAPDTAGAA